MRNAFRTTIGQFSNAGGRAQTTGSECARRGAGFRPARRRARQFLHARGSVGKRRRVMPHFTGRCSTRRRRPSMRPKEACLRPSCRRGAQRHVRSRDMPTKRYPRRTGGRASPAPSLQGEELIIGQAGPSGAGRPSQDIDQFPDGPEDVSRRRSVETSGPTSKSCAPGSSRAAPCCWLKVIG